MKSTTAPVTELVKEETVGWPLHVWSIAKALHMNGGRVNDIERLCRRGPHIDEIHRQFWYSVPHSAKPAVGLVLNLKRLTPTAADIVAGTESGLQHLRSSGLPLEQLQDGTLRVPEVLSECHRSSSMPTAANERLDGSVVMPLANELIRAFGLTDTIEGLTTAGHAAEVGCLLENLVGRDLVTLTSPRLLSRIDGLASSSTTPAKLHLLGAQVLEAQGNVAAAIGAFSTAADAAEIEQDSAVAVEALLRQLIIGLAIDSAYDAEDTPGAQLRERLTSLGIGSPGNQLLQRELEVVKRWTSNTQLDISASLAIGQALVGDLVAANRPAAAARLCRRLAAAPAEHLWRYQTAAELLDRSVTIEQAAGLPVHPASDILRLGVAAELGDRSRFGSLSEGANRALRNETQRGMIASVWSARMTEAALRGDAEDTLMYSTRAVEHFADFAGTHVEAYFRARVVTALSYCRLPQAETQLNIVRQLHDLNPTEAALAELTFESRCGDPELATRLAQSLGSSEQIPFERRWQIDAELLHAKQRSGQPVNVEEVDLVLARAREFGLGQRAEAMLSSVEPCPQATDRSSAVEDRSHPVAITTFGRFGIEVGDTRSEAGNAVPYQFIKLLCIRGPVLSVDAVIDHIWPEADTATGRRRLKNLVSRARSILGADAIARNADFLSLEAHVRVDYEQFQDLSLIAFAPSSPLETATSAAWDALRIATGGLLPDDRFLTWADEPRWQADIAIQGLLRHLLLNESPGSAGRLLQAARRFDSTESTLLFDISRLALDADDRSVAIQAIDAARHLHAAADEPFVLPRDLERYLAD